MCIVNGGVVPLTQDVGAPNHKYYNSTFDQYPNPQLLFGTGGYVGDGDDDRPNFERTIDALLDNLAQPGTRNFYWFGFGTPTVERVGSKVIKASQLADALENFSWTWTGTQYGMMPALHVPQHPYRFAFIDACRGAEKPYWAKAFGIPKSLSYSQLSENVDRAQAFLGWALMQGNREIRAVGAPDGCEWYACTLWAFFDQWMDDVPLYSGAYLCARPSPLQWYIYDREGIYLDLPQVVTMGAPEQTGIKVDGSSVKIYGYPYITRNGIAQPPLQ
jgi:hypothetical protein